MAKLNDFITQVRSRGLMRSNRYEVIIPFPNRTASSDTMKLATLYCESVSLPGINVATTGARVYGESREMPYERTFEPVQLSFYCDSDLLIKKAFESWINLIVDPQTRAISYYNSYIKDVTIYAQTVDDKSTQVITLFEAYPKSIQSISMDYNSREIMKMTVTMQYKYWKSDATAFTTSTAYTSNALQFDMSKPVLQYTGFQSGDPAGYNTGSGVPQSVIRDTSTPAMDFGWLGNKK